jgi:ABC-2 type transport system permease protein
VNEFLGLVRSEIRRALSRRLFRLLAALAVLGVLFAVVLVFIQSSSDPRSGLAEARREAAFCERARAEGVPDFPEEEGFVCPSVEEFRQQFDRRFRYADTIPDVSRGVAFPLFALSLVVGASFVGAEWGSGTMGTLLTWEPRRGRVLSAKVLACVLLLAPAVALVLAFIAVVFFPVAVFRGTTRGMDGSMWWTLAGTWIRAAGIGVFAGAVGAALATLARNTAGSIAVGFAYGLLADPLLGQWREGRYETWLLRHNLPRLMGIPMAVPQSGEPTFGGALAFEPPRVLSPTRPIVLLSIYAIALIALAYASFRARDVT